MKFRDPKPVDTVIAIHMYYFDMLDDLCVHIDKLREHMDFEVIVSTTEDNKPHIEEIARKLDAFRVLLVENRGRDVLPFLKALRHVEGFKYACKIHTKTTGPKAWIGPYKHSFGNWRDLMWNTLMNPVEVKKIIRFLENDTAIYAPSNLWLRKIHQGHFKKNLENMKKIEEVVGMKLSKQPFIAGTMFWFDVNRLIWLNNYDLEDLFEPEEGATDGKMEHAFERCLVQLARKPLERINGIVTNERYDKEKIYNHVMSLGHGCQASAHLKRRGLSRVSFPFDWIGDASIHNEENEFKPMDQEEVSGYVKVIENDFNGLWNAEDLDVTIVEKWGDNPQKVVDRKYNIGSVHEFEVGHVFDNIERVQMMFERRIKRFNSVMNSNEPVLLIRTMMNERSSRLMSDMISKKYPNLDFTILVINREYEPLGSWDIPNVIKINLEFAPDWDALNPSYNHLWNNIFNSFNIKMKEVRK